MRQARISFADIAVLALLAGLAIATALLQNRHQPMALHDQAIRTIIGAQIEAFRRDDDLAAFGFASPDLRAQLVAPNRLWRWCGRIIDRFIWRKVSALLARHGPLPMCRKSACRMCIWSMIAAPVTKRAI